MSFIAQSGSKLWNYIHGEYYHKHDFLGVYKKDMSIATNRFFYLEELSRQDHKFKLSFREIESNCWTKWTHFPSLLTRKGNLTAAIDVHRSVLPNEIVIESDYPTYEENYEAAKIIGRILENKGFTPHYYYSGNKSVHIHVFLNTTFMEMLDMYLVDTLKDKCNSNILETFMEWLRTKMITCWDTNAKEFDKDLIKSTHLIRAELSKNKKGFKTFLGYSHRDMSPVPIICNEENMLYPRLAEIKESFPEKPMELLNEFIDDYNSKKQSKIIKKKSTSREYVDYKSGKLRPMVESVLNADTISDGKKRLCFVLLNELRKTFGDEKAKPIILEWNERHGLPLPVIAINKRFENNTYVLTNNYIDTLLKEIGYKC